MQQWGWLTDSILDKTQKYIKWLYLHQEKQTEVIHGGKVLNSGYLHVRWAYGATGMVGILNILVSRNIITHWDLRVIIPTLYSLFYLNEGTWK